MMSTRHKVQQQQQVVSTKEAADTADTGSLFSLIIKWIKFIVIYLYNIIPNLLLPPQPTTTVTTTDTKTDTNKQQQTKTKRKRKSVIQTQDLFPSIEQHVISNNDKPQSIINKDIPKPKACSTGLTTRLLPFKNEKGEIEWAFTDDTSVTPGNELDAFKIQQQPIKEEPPIELSPTISNTSNDSTLSQKMERQDTLKDHQSSVTPATTLFSPEDESSLMLDESDDKDSISSQDEGSDGNKVHQCPHCDATFKIRGYLTRHLKKHAVNKAYSCPYHKISIYIDENNITHKCHPNGGFSRRDTYKTHLKSRHFKYPKGTKTKERSSSAGECSMCGEPFPNAEIWCELHVEGGECKYLPTGFKGKSRIKNRLRKQLEKNKEVDPELLPYASKVLDEVNNNNTVISRPNSTRRKSSQESNNMDTPISLTSGATPFESSINSTSPPGGYTPISSTSSKSPVHYNTMNANPYVTYPHKQQLQQQHIHPQPRRELPPSFEQFDIRHSTTTSNTVDHENDYDDEFCLDIDQLNNATFNNFNEVVNFVKLNSNNQSPVGGAIQFSNFHPVHHHHAVHQQYQHPRQSQAQHQQPTQVMYQF
ncbi:STP2 [[Candida] subhashii]|uniref:STP2 n=1 Tax=[Candida] subhashii TaxID=561895 RepID=A0A8J5QG40_9ASCO|nr:STP2 [[Candida] subhashii]KAG7660683.1 STP2 [[Candida] subhashii]